MAETRIADRGTVRKLRAVETGAPAANPRTWPRPLAGFSAPPELLPGVLMVWDFCHRYRCVETPGRAHSPQHLLVWMAWCKCGAHFMRWSLHPMLESL